MRLEIAEEPAGRKSGKDQSNHDWHQVWTCNISDSGICFCSDTPIRPGRICVREGGQVSGPWLGMEIVRCRKLSSQLWEYGGVKCDSDSQMAFEIPQSEFKELHSRLAGTSHRGDQADHVDRDQEHSTPSPASIDRQLMLTLRQVAHWSSRVEQQEDRWRIHRRLSALIKLFILCFATFFLVQAFSGVIVSAAGWWALTTLMALLLVADWRVSRRLRELEDSPPHSA